MGIGPDWRVEAIDEDRRIMRCSSERGAPEE